ncbi:MAG: hypothetical protein QGI24_09345 [Kiritimatiellia bacterium]|jgi:hypothetical protein|nr:hypothetical protein [Kiritimatiellia bacterium]MDP6848979.1 hypothetical protein [Kiritimatiellia bacterium]
MKQLTTILLVACALTSAEAKPPFGGTIFVSPDIVTDDDPTAFKKLTRSGKGVRRMFDRRIRKFAGFEAHLFTATFKDGQTMEVQVNPEFSADEAYREAKKYLPTIGQLPFTLREKAATVWIHKGNHGFGGGNNNLLIHTDMGEGYISKGILAEAFFHEAAHTSLDGVHARNEKWIAAQKKDGEFISGYAKGNPKGEDIAESFLLYFAVRYKPERIDKTLKDKIKKTMPNRIAYFDSLQYEMFPVEGKPKGAVRPVVEAR